MDECICPMCGIKHNNKNVPIRPFCSYGCIDKDAQRGGKWIKLFIGNYRIREIVNCIVCGKIIFARKYCSPDCHRVYVKAINKNRREAIPKDVKDRIYIKYKYKCFYCGDYGDCIDHIVPVAKGGRTADANLVVSCQPCNSAAGSKVFDNVNEKKKFILQKRGISFKDDIVVEEYIRPSWHAAVYSGRKKR